MKTNKRTIEDVENWANEYGDMLFRFALVRVGDENIAADVVQNTLLAAVSAKDSFQGKSTIRTWLLGILKHKIMDYFRQRRKENLIIDSELATLETPEFTPDGMWLEKPREWNFTPEQVLENEEARKILWECIDMLPERMRLLFILREIDGESTKTICERMNISASNFSVLLFRTRHKLRKEFNLRGVKMLRML